MQKSAPIKVLIVDDEPAARVRLEDLLKGHEDVALFDPARSGPEAIDRIESLRPDLVFLDVQMPGMSGLDVLRRLDPANMPIIVFVTAYDQYAIQAFDLAAVDYLLKPFSDDRFERALMRSRNEIRQKSFEGLHERLNLLVESLERPPLPAGERYLERIAVEMRGQIRVVPVEDIDYILASGSYVELHVGENVYLVNEQMQTLEERLDPVQYFRIHRSTIVKLSKIETLLVGSGGDYAACLSEGRRLKVSRRRWDDLVNRLGIRVQKQY